ncbi:sigma factor-like helix-turn-helix DNA-binding protein [Bacillus salitolerans]|uniref:Sigma factor-like helix-turn-helix DNA-binding protein n=1 Tax=Bacillus salitolerans TaxID=1437434 RepID=A0ABW4LL02_9BACI
MGKLPDKYQNSIFLFYYHDMSLQEIAKKLEIPKIRLIPKNSLKRFL